MVDVIQDKAGQKGTGKWTIISALDFGIPVSTMSEAVFARCISALKSERVEAAKILKGPSEKIQKEKKAFIEAVRDSLYASKVCSYAQGFALMSAVSKDKGWDLNLGSCAMIWRGGCIIRARFLQRIKDAYDKNSKLANLLLDPYFSEVLSRRDSNTNLQRFTRLLRQLSQRAASREPVAGSARLFRLAYLRAYRPARWKILPSGLGRR
jgi:6-phosphogluconate dehydrogenase